MALFKISKGKSTNLPTNKVDGYCYVTTNDHKFYVDYTKDDGTLDRFALNAAYADGWVTSRNLNGMVVNGTSNVINYGICSTAAATAAKVVSCSNFGLITGAEITVKFTTTNTAANPTLNVNSTGAKAIYYRGSAISAGYLAANRTYTFRYNGSQYDLVGDLDTNTTYSAGAGLTLSGTQFKHSNSVTAGTAQGDANKTLTFGGTFTIPTVSYDAQGHITGKGTTTMTMPANPNTDTRVIQTAVDASGYTNWRPLIFGSSNSGTEGFNPGTTTDGVFTTQTLSCQPSSGTIKANTFKGSLSGNAATASKLATARTIALTGSVTGSGSFDGSGNLSIATTTNHTHSYAGSSSAGGSANSAVKLDTATAGDSNTPVYFSGGKPVACTSLDLNTSGNAASASALVGYVSSGAVPLTDPGAGIIKYYYNVNYDLTGNMPSANNANGILYLNTHNGEYGYQLGFSSDGNIYYRNKSSSAFTNSIAWNKVLSSSNYNDYAPTKTGTGASGTWGINISGTAAAASSVSWSNVSGKPSTYTPSSHTHDDRYYTESEINSKLSGKSDTGHTHNYAGSSSAGGSANSAVKLDSSAGSATQPVYFNNGKPTQCNSTLGVSISGNAATASSVAWGNISGKPSSYTPSSHTHDQYLPLSAGESKKLTGPLGLTKNVNYGTSLPSSGFTGQLFFLEDGDVSQGDLPIASATVSGIVTTGTQTFAGNKTFNNNVYFGANGGYGYVDSNGIHGAMWNDYAEFRNQFEDIEPGYCVASADNGKVYKTTEKFQACDGIVSDTFGFSIGKTDECKTPLAVAGRVLAYCEGERSDYHAGDTVCAGINGLVCKMTREEIKEYPDRIIGIVSEIPDYETWGSGNVPVNGRIWIKVK